MTRAKVRKLETLAGTPGPKRARALAALIYAAQRCRVAEAAMARLFSTQGPVQMRELARELVEGV
jgi:hypothetical protein